MKLFKTSNIRVVQLCQERNRFILNCRVFNLLVVEKCFQISFSCKCLSVKIVFFVLFLFYHLPLYWRIKICNKSGVILSILSVTVTDISATVIAIDVKARMTVELSSGRKVSLLVTISLGGHQMRYHKGEGVGFWASKNSFDREYLDNGKSQRYMSIRT